MLAHLATRDIQEQLVKASSGFDIPLAESFMDFKTWQEVEPPKYTIYNFPPRDDVIPHLPGSVAAPDRYADVGTGDYDENDRAAHANRAFGR